MSGRLQAVIIEVSDLDASVQLYAGAFGVDLHTGDHEGEAGWQGDRWITGRHAATSWKDGAFLHFAIYEAKTPQATTFAQVDFVVDDLEAAHDGAVAAGADVVHPPRDEPWGSTARYRDLDGNTVSLTQPR